MEEIKKYLESIHFQYDDNNDDWSLENRDCSFEHQSEYMGSDQCTELFNKYFTPIAKQIKEKAKEFKIKISFETSLEYGELMVRIKE